MKAKRRIIYAVLSFVLLLTEIYIALYVHDDFIRPYFGDVLVTLLLCCLFRVFVPMGVHLLPIYVFLFATAVEVAQYLNVIKLLGLENSRFFSTLLGTSFSVYDLICYAAGCLMFTAVEFVVLKISGGSKNA